MSNQAQRKRSSPSSLSELFSEFDEVKKPPLSTPVRSSSEFDKLCEKLGGPADLGILIDSDLMNAFRRYCREYRPHQVIPILCQFAKADDDGSAARHYPWAALAIGQYNFETKELAKYTDEPAPKEILELFRCIDSAAKELISSLAKIQSLSYRLGDSSAPSRRGHLSWFNSFFAQAIAGRPSSDVNNYEFGDDLQKLAFIKQLAQLRAAAKKAPDHFDKTLVERERAQKNPALLNFVGRCAMIWKNMTKRTPSASKTDSTPDFVVFVRELAKVGTLPAPSRKQVETALKRTTV